MNEERFIPHPYFNRLTGGKEELGAYIVHGADNVRKRVEAHTASEALRLSGIENPVRITRFDPMSMTILPIPKHAAAPAVAQDSV